MLFRGTNLFIVRPCKTHKYPLWAECRFLFVKAGGTCKPLVFKGKCLYNYFSSGGKYDRVNHLKPEMYLTTIEKYGYYFI
jgi:hypothetical protein